MIEALLDALAAPRRRSDLVRTHIAAGTWLTPKELQALLISPAVLPWESRAWLADLAAAAGAGEAPQGYDRLRLHVGVDLYSDPDAPSRDKRLVIALCGRSHRLMLPIVAFLQNVPSAQYDVLVLRDDSEGHFLNGIAGYADGLPALLARLGADLPLRRYSGLVCYGTSMGGFAALRCGLLLAAERAVAVGGSFPWHVKRLTGETEPALPAFDPLCGCVPTPSRTSLISIYASCNRTDLLHHERLSRMRRVTSVAVPIAEHNVVYDALQRGQLKQFLGFALGLHDSMSWLPREDTVSVALSARASLLLRAKRAWQRRRDGGLGPAQAMGSLVSQGMRRLRTGRVTAGSR